MTTRIDYMIMCAECLDDEDCKRLFNLDRDEMLDGTATWNQAIEYAYSEYVSNEEFENELDEDEISIMGDNDIEDGFSQNMPSDTTGLCSPNCPRIYSCPG